MRSLSKNELRVRRREKRVERRQAKSDIEAALTEHLHEKQRSAEERQSERDARL